MPMGEMDMARSTLAGAMLSLLCMLGGATSALAANSHASTTQEIVRLWPGQAPGTADWSKPETSEQVRPPGARRAIQIIKNVTEPSLTVIRPAVGHASGAGMIVLPGGGFGALAWDLEGMEVARWLADRGVTAFVLKYRVYDGDPTVAAKIAEIWTKSPPAKRFYEAMTLLEPRRKIATEDAIQAIRLIRSTANKYGVSADRIGMMGFSAGAITTMSTVMESDASTRPNFAAPIYGALVSDASPPKEGPPLFIVVASDDDTTPAAKSVAIFQAWQAAKLRAELHVYENGGHGFGLGTPGTASAHWTDAFEAWLSAHAIVSKREKSL
jgi:dienelactone hydrolase